MWVLTSVYHENIQNPSNPHWPLSSCSLTCTKRHDARPNWMRHVSHFYMFLKRGSNWNIKMELTVVSYSLNSSHCTASQWTQQIWDPDFSCDSTFAFVAAGADAVLIYWKKNQNKLATTSLSRSVPLTTGKVYLSNQSKYCNQRHFCFFPVLHLKDEDEEILLYTDYILMEIKYILEEN